MAMEFVDRVACDLAEDGDLESLGNNALAIKSYRGRQFVPPVTVRLGGVAEYLESMAEDAVQVFPEVHVLEGAYRLLLVHLEEALLVTGGDPVSVTIEDRGIVVSRAVPSDGGATEVVEELTGDGRSWTAELDERAE
jgi:hypothetical protein